MQSHINMCLPAVRHGLHHKRVTSRIQILALGSTWIIACICLSYCNVATPGFIFMMYNIIYCVFCLVSHTVLMHTEP